MTFHTDNPLALRSRACCYCHSPYTCLHVTGLLIISLPCSARGMTRKPQMLGQRRSLEADTSLPWIKAELTRCSLSEEQGCNGSFIFNPPVIFWEHLFRPDHLKRSCPRHPSKCISGREVDVVGVAVGEAAGDVGQVGSQSCGELGMSLGTLFINVPV